MKNPVLILACVGLVAMAAFLLFARRPKQMKMGRPELKQFGDLTEADFERHPVWIGVHTVDTNEPWYDETDEETFRPRLASPPARLSEGMLLVKATFRLADGSLHRGFATPAQDAEDIATMQPQLFAGGRRFGFWHGMLAVSASEREALYRVLGRVGDRVFPLTFEAAPGLTSDLCRGTVQGFLSYTPDHRVRVER